MIVYNPTTARFEKQIDRDLIDEAVENACRFMLIDRMSERNARFHAFQNLPEPERSFAHLDFDCVLTP